MLDDVVEHAEEGPPCNEEVSSRLSQWRIRRTTLPFVLDLLLLAVEGRVVDAGRSSDTGEQISWYKRNKASFDAQDIEASRNVGKTSVRRESLIVAAGEGTIGQLTGTRKTEKSTHSCSMSRKRRGGAKLRSMYACRIHGQLLGRYSPWGGSSTDLLEGNDLTRENVLDLELDAGEFEERGRDEVEGEKRALGPAAHGANPQSASAELLDNSCESLLGLAAHEILEDVGEGDDGREVLVEAGLELAVRVAL